MQLHAWRKERLVLGTWGDHVTEGHFYALARVEPDRGEINVWDILERYAIDDDALRHAERHVGRHLHGAKMTRRETQRTQFGRAISWRVVTCPHMGNIPSKNISPQKT